LARRNDSYNRSDADAVVVERMVVAGIVQDAIAIALGCSVDTLQRHYRDILDQAGSEANATVAAALFDNAVSGNVVAQIFWMKSRAGWKDRDVTQHQLLGQDGEPISPVVSLTGDEADFEACRNFAFDLRKAEELAKERAERARVIEHTPVKIEH
jgi:hypothetical protein